MNLEQIEKRVFDTLSDIKIIDAHEHLLPEKIRIARKVDFFLLFSFCSQIDFISAGMTLGEYARLRDDQDMPVEEKWKIFREFYPITKYGSFARPASIWLKEVLGYDELTEKNYKEVSEKLQEQNKPGIYNRILRVATIKQSS